jgi:putative FmdB family regulatory protein
MPNYEFRCRKCGKAFAVTMSVSERDKLALAPKKPTKAKARSPHGSHKATVQCPKCKGVDLEQQLGAFFVKTSRKS